LIFLSNYGGLADKEKRSLGKGLIFHVPTLVKKKRGENNPGREALHIGEKGQDWGEINGEGARPRLGG